MKIQVLKSGEEGLVGYNTIYLNDKYVDLEIVSDNECEEILLQEDLLSDLSYEDATNVLVAISAKLRKSGIMRMVATDLRLVCKEILYGQMSEQDANQLFATKNFLISAHEMTTILHHIGLHIETMQLNGLQYEFSATR